jgi:neutral ceramidase
MLRCFSIAGASSHSSRSSFLLCSPGDFDFHQATTSPNPFWSWISSFLAKPTPEQIDCQAPKPILLDVGLVEPIEWVPYILPEQVVRIGNLWILAVPGEWTTMRSGANRDDILSCDW